MTQRPSAIYVSGQDSSTLSVRYLFSVLEAARLRGHAPEALCRAAGFEIPPSDDPDLRYRTRDYQSLWRVATREVGDARFLLDVIRVAAPWRSNVLGFAAISSETMGDALDRISKYLLIMTDGARWQLERSHDQARLELARPPPIDFANRHGDEFAIAHVVYWTRELTGVDWAPRRVTFSHPEPSPSELATLREIFRAPLVFSGERSEMTFDAKLLGLPLLKAEPKIAEFFDRHIEEILERTYAGEGLVGTLRRSLIQALSSGSCTLDAVAKRIGLSARTVRRQLAAQGKTFQMLLDELRSELAQQYLRERKLSIGEISFALGYAEPAPFHRAFRRWTGMTPATYRQRVHGEIA